MQLVTPPPIHPVPIDRPTRAPVVPGQRVVRLQGEHDVSTAASLRQLLARVSAAGDSDLVLDLSEVSFLGAATISVMLDTSDALRRESRRLFFRSPSPCAERIIDLCGLGPLVLPASRDTGVTATWLRSVNGDRVLEALRAEFDRLRPVTEEVA